MFFLTIIKSKLTLTNSATGLQQKQAESVDHHFYLFKVPGGTVCSFYSMKVLFYITLSAVALRQLYDTRTTQHCITQGLYNIVTA